MVADKTQTMLTNVITHEHTLHTYLIRIPTTNATENDIFNNDDTLTKYTSSSSVEA